jgi:hypothetical protein
MARTKKKTTAAAAAGGAGSVVPAIAPRKSPVFYPGDGVKRTQAGELLWEMQHRRCVEVRSRMWDHYLQCSAAGTLLTECRRDSPATRELYCDYNRAFLADEAELEELESDTEYGVEAILGKRADSEGSVEYLVKWENCSSEQNSWEPESSMEHCQETVREFEQSLASRA